MVSNRFTYLRIPSAAAAVFFALPVILSLLPNGSVFAQQRDTVVMNATDFESVVTYSARDSIYSDFRKNQVHLYGNAHLTYEGVDMKADYLLIDFGLKEVYATYTLDSLGNRVGSPVFVQDGDTIRTASLRYNYETNKAYIKEVAIHQDEFYLSMEIGKRQANEELHFVHGKFTTCNLTEPHYHFFLSRAVMVPDKRIVTGPMNLWIMGVPTPLGLPFSIIPQRKERERRNGFIMPQITAVSAYGFGFQDLGYYIPVNDRFQTTLYGTLYSRGSFGIRSASEYAKRYRFIGSLNAGYQFLRTGWPDSTHASNITLNWIHRQDAKANPKWSFNSAINFNSESNNKQTLNPQNSQYFNNTLNSDINLGRVFIGTPLSARMKASMRQNSQSGRITATSPEFNLTATRFYPFKRRKAVGRARAYETIGMTYFLDAANRADFADSLLPQGDIDRIGQSFMNGARHSSTLQWTLNMFRNTVRFTPSVTYSQKYNFQSIDKTLDTVTNVVVVDTLDRGVFSQQLSTSGSLSTNFYSYYRFIGKRQSLLRHVMTPGVTFTYGPGIQGGIDTYERDTLTQQTVYYSQLERSIYAESYVKSTGRIDFSLNNAFELKQRSDKDTVTGFRKIRLVDNMLFTQSYDIFRDSMNWGNLGLSMVINPIEVLNININASHSWYGWNPVTGKNRKEFAIQTGQGIGRIANASISTLWTITSKKSRDILQSQTAQMSTVWNPQYQNWTVMPAQIVSFDIPWKITFNHIIGYTLNANQNEFATRRYVPDHTLQVNGDITLTENWKVTATTYFDVQEGKVANTNFTLFRNIHCWNVVFVWTPIGTNKSFTITIRGNGQALSNAQLRLQRPPLVL